MLDKTKTDAELGAQIRTYLLSKGVETPIKVNATDPNAPTISDHIKSIMFLLGLDLDDDSLSGTPKRIEKMFQNEIFWGLKIENFPKITLVENKMKYDEMIIEKNIKVMSTCEHHLVTIAGSCHIAYIPKRKVMGLSKLNRVVEYFSKRPQIQERLTEQIYYALEHILKTEDIAVIIEAEHFCVKSRGVEDINSTTVTSKVGGVFRDDKSVKSEFFNLLSRGNK